jgi:hypothetical protein
VNTDLATTGTILIPVVIILILTQKAVIGANIPLQARVVGPGGVNHDTFDSNGSACLIAGIFS